MRLPGALAGRAERLWQDADRDYRAALLDALPHDPTARLLDVGSHDGSWTDLVARRLGVPPAQVAVIVT